MSNAILCNHALSACCCPPDCDCKQNESCRTDQNPATMTPAAAALPEEGERTLLFVLPAPHTYRAADGAVILEWTNTKTADSRCRFSIIFEADARHSSWYFVRLGPNPSAASGGLEALHAEKLAGYFRELAA